MSGSNGEGVLNSFASGYLHVILLEAGLNSDGSTYFHNLIFRSWLLAWVNLRQNSSA